MSPRSRITTIAILALLFMALIFGARGIARHLTAPLEGLEQFARSRGAVAPESEDEYQEPLRHIDWDAPETPAPAPFVKPKPTARLALSRALRLEAGQPMVVASLRQLAEIKYVFNDEPNLESLSSALYLTEAQKAMVSALLDWRKWSLDALAEVNGAEDSKELISRSFREAVESLLDPDQREKYKLSNKPLTSLAFRASLTGDGNGTASNAMREYIQRVISERK